MKVPLMIIISMAFLIIVVNIAVIAGIVWVVVAVLQAMGVL